jgi:hypothetical protein
MLPQVHYRALDGQRRQVCVDDQKARELLLHHLRYSGGVGLAKAHEHHHDAVLELPQSGERFVGNANILGWRQQYPAHERRSTSPSRSRPGCRSSRVDSQGTPSKRTGCPKVGL